MTKLTLTKIIIYSNFKFETSLKELQIEGEMAHTQNYAGNQKERMWNV